MSLENPLPNFIKEAKEFSFSRKLGMPKKITPEFARQNIETAMILGEISGTERVLTTILDLKKTYPDFTMEDLEAALHEHLHKGLTYVSETLKIGGTFTIDRILKEYGYFDKGEV
jgi:uncharacterized protein (DUF433 family)